ncbi:hypothetical protein [Agrobacterium tumefaciens]|uniref:hypothetical protein n=1 Tax=Agrobacterium tumefaciens TaxID=358 RepID=UPI001BABBAF5|nr:hypothetical protein [Agrobacterium tumefaciens]
MTIAQWSLSIGPLLIAQALTFIAFWRATRRKQSSPASPAAGDGAGPETMADHRPR